MSVEAYPLHWPQGWPLTPVERRASAAFKTRFAKARDELFNEIRLLGGRYVVLSTNVELRRDGLPYAKRHQPEDTGVAVYFEYKGKSMVFACDRWRLVEDNVQAVRKTVEALRGIERWGASDMMELAFSGFEALPPPGRNWWEVLGVDRWASTGEINTAYRLLAKKFHPDKGGTAAAMTELSKARAEAEQ